MHICVTVYSRAGFVFVPFPTKFIAASSLGPDSTQLNSTRLDSTRLDSTRLDSTRLDSTHSLPG
ncbi:hypothetical protein G9C98_004585 [Cotesia typhae]|uniref:Uncharacterized protein n=1 Tax=Cotesia typhae TaxID=2053667 RepID=A0A8J5R0Q9_9HYME|nr:hypothetical protein G9C98_004585 [Cotesia typhae]